MSNDETISHARWARFRFSVVGSLLAAPPSRGDLRAAMEHLTRTTWVHPLTGAPVRLGFSTIERWYYAARGALGARSAGTQGSSPAWGRRCGRSFMRSTRSTGAGP